MKYKLRVTNPEIVEAYPTQYYVATLEKKMSAEEFDKLYEPVIEEKKYIVEFRYQAEDWARSGNRGASGVFDSFEEANRQAKIQEDSMGSGYTYRVVPLP